MKQVNQNNKVTRMVVAILSPLLMAGCLDSYNAQNREQAAGLVAGLGAASLTQMKEEQLFSASSTAAPGCAAQVENKSETLDCSTLAAPTNGVFQGTGIIVNSQRSVVTCDGIKTENAWQEIGRVNNCELCVISQHRRSDPCPTGQIGSISMVGNQTTCPSATSVAPIQWSEASRTCRTPPPPVQQSSSDSGGSDCFADMHKVLFTTGYITLKNAAYEIPAHTLVTVASNATLERMTYSTVPLENIVLDSRATVELVYLKGQSGGFLAVTPAHPVMNHEGRLLQARDFKVGDSMIRLNGKADRLVEVRNFMYKGSTRNVVPRSDMLTSNLIIAEGYITGSYWYETVGQRFMGQQILRQSLAGM